MRKTEVITRKPIPQKFFSPFLSCQRLRKIQAELKPRGEGCDKNPEAVLAVLGIDSRYNEGSREFADYLLFGFFTLRQRELERDGIEDEDIEDVILLVTHDAVHMYCSMVLYEYLLPYVIHWRNVCIYCMNPVTEDERDRDKEEEYKIKSFLSMVEDCKHIGISYFISSNDKDASKEKMLLEKWPLIQSFASEEFGKGAFFTMHHNVVNYHGQLTDIYNDCDAVVLEKMIASSLPLFQRHWLESVNIVDAAAKAGNLQKLTEKQILEPIICYFNHGRLMANRHMHKKLSNAAINSPYVIFGARTQEFASNPSSKENVSIKSMKDASTHMIFHCKAPKGPLVCSRTYFIKNKTASTETKRNQEELCKLYKHCAEAAQIAIKTYASSLSSAMACAEASTHLLKARTTLTFKPECSITACDKLGRKVPLVDGQSTSHIKTVKIIASDVRDSKQCIGAVVFEDTFTVSSIDVSDANGDRRDYSFHILTSLIPTSLQWMVADALSVKEDESDVIMGGVPCWSNSSLFSESPEVTLKVSLDGEMFVMNERFGIVDITKADNLFYYDGNSPGKVGLFAVDFGKTSTTLNSIPSHLHSSMKMKSSDAETANQCLVFYLLPGSASYKIFTSKVLHKTFEHFKISAVDSVSTEMEKVHEEIESNTKKQNSNVNREKEYLKHFKASSIVSGNKLSPEVTSVLLGRPNEPLNQDGKVCVTVLMGLPCSRTMELCNSLVSVNKEHVRWVVVKVQDLNNGCGKLDRQHLEDQLTQAVSKKKVTRPSAAARKKLRIILLAVGFFEASEIVRSVLFHSNKETRLEMFIGSVTTCIWPRSLMLDHRRTLPRLLDQCTIGFVNNIVFTVPQNDSGNTKEKHLALAQSLVRGINPPAAHIISTEGKLSHQNDFVFVLNEKTFNSEQEVRNRQMILPNVESMPSCDVLPHINRVHLEFSQALMKGSLNAHLRSLKLKRSSIPYNGNIYFITGCIAFTDDPSQQFDLTYSSLDGDIELVPRVIQMQQPAPPPSKEHNQNKKHNFQMTFYGVSLDKVSMMNWLRETGRQRPSKKCVKTKSHLTINEINAIKEEYKNAPLPEGYFYNGTQYVNLMDNLKTYEHPCMDRFVEEYLLDKNKEISAYNAKLAAEGFVDLFA